MPNFFIIGAMRSGTTSLYHCVGQHPEVYVSPIKEPTFFDEESRWSKRVATIEQYHALFRGVSGEKAIGEASTAYLPSRGAAERIRQHVPHAKLIAILRDPVERAYSHFLHNIRLGHERILDFTRAVQDSTNQYVQPGFYHAQLTSYIELFPRAQLSVHLYEDLRDTPQTLMQEIFRFLGVDESFMPDLSTRYNVSPRHRGLLVLSRHLALRTRPLAAIVPRGIRHRIRGLVGRALPARMIPPPSPALRKELVQLYRNDVLKLQEMLQRDLTNWLE